VNDRLESWLLTGASKDTQSITADWKRAPFQLIDGVSVREVANVPKDNGHLTEAFRADWFSGEQRVDQVFQLVLNPGGISAWHAHASTLDRLFVSYGVIRIVLFDNRESSPTRGLLNEFRFGTIRPALVTVPPRIWHGVQNIGIEPAILINMVDRAYEYEDPDHWRIAPETELIPFRW
jgi:dTDP-4-dehydrorhamnose 3,5-epimerase